ncbi:MAG: LCP family protein, partial [Bacillota bacterium]
QQLLSVNSTGSDKGSTVTATSREEKPRNILIIGTDARGKERARSDALILVSIDSQKKTVKMLSVPRDTYVDVPGHGNMKINSAHAYGGYRLSEQTVEDFLGVPIDNYVETNFQGFKNIIDILGGLTLDVEQRMYRPSEDINLHKGVQKLDGEKALAYVRFREYKMGDIDRVEHQQRFIKALYSQTFHLGTLAKLPFIVQQIWQNINTDMSVTDIIKLATAIRGLSSDQLQTMLLPGSPDYIDGVSYWIAESDKGREFIEGNDQEQLTQKSFGISEQSQQ